ncbi:MAG: hypothetical protein ACJ79E_02280 [Anaeromyxobacteraceae bacterium]
MVESTSERERSHTEGDELDAIIARQRQQGASRGRALAWPAALFLVITATLGVDLAADVASGTSAIHLLAEVIALLVAIGGVVGTGLTLRRSQRDGDTLLSELELTTLDLAHWRSETRRSAVEAPRLR